MWSSLTTILGFKREPSAPVPGAIPPALAPVPQQGVTLHEQRHRYRQCLAQFGHLPPREASVAAFVAMMQEIGWAGEWDYAKLLREYDIVCKGTGASRMPAKWFWIGLSGAGCHRWRDEREKEGNYGNRSRPYVIWIPKVASDAGTGDVIPSGKVEAYRAEKRRTGARSGTPKVAGNRQGKGGRYSADISPAVAMR